jgi:hypothetical protein
LLLFFLFLLPTRVVVVDEIVGVWVGVIIILLLLLLLLEVVVFGVVKLLK